eukprot:880500-Pleurochrysis_carterae.AAC.1
MVAAARGGVELVISATAIAAAARKEAMTAAAQSADTSRRGTRLEKRSSGSKKHTVAHAVAPACMNILASLSSRLRRKQGGLANASWVKNNSSAGVGAGGIPTAATAAAAAAAAAAVVASVAKALSLAERSSSAKASAHVSA